ncbi:ABC transporter ATP-binding protein [Corynebacterium kutscheri]|uniref:ABC transporter ATP-binding protein n=1 Tax=Corynebacterium kutscheri TaxID=35755 RepID=A0A0F6R165_9CORY|nr:ATP-binding cassette domain-containing protein [Corynebacterium kutscheri]AKE42137.1 ATPase component of Mn/Zn ABC-type transporter [Corynebacterium kutscheri]VEH05907.1 ABC transporter ATP-binding protein [Corynebacterium kutscheri]VEH10480.1 ABC transporter ATP-binding protein [Corynebacterium kutscheri]VEH81796.1 ABC transporter ATP-binding protein [Corynebacterium kutscheri]
MILSVEKASYGYDAPVVSDITMSVNGGEAVAVLGPNGSGKTTFLMGILGLARRFQGEMTLTASRLAYVPQVAELDRTFPVTAGDVVGMALKRRDKAAVNSALERVGLAERKNVRFGNLSGGQQQRVLVARAIVTNPELVVFDEPFNGLDAANREMLLRLFADLKANKTAIISSTHDLSLATQACEKALVVGAEPRFGKVSDVVE